ncbi:MAG: hypothetical protein NZ770_03525 [Candidatus Poseidoniaceae archaeon]|nr:hypothetical protein [Candidatus Poseidoniaceae archaeon]
MGTGLKLMLALGAIGTFGFYLARVSEMTEGAQWGFIGAILLQSFLFVVVPGKQKKVVVRKKLVEMEAEDEVEEIAANLPEPVKSDPLDGATLRERKMAKIKPKEEEDSDSDEEIQIAAEDIEAIEDVHIADQYVVEIDAESIEESRIEDTVDERRRRHAEIRQRIEARRREQMAEVRASAAKMWDDNQDREDMVAVLSDPEHGLMVLDEPASVSPGHPYGSTFIRIDDERVVKVRIPLDAGFRKVETEEPEGLPLPSGLPLPGGLPLPLPAGGLPLPPPPMIGTLPPPVMESQSKLAALRNEMDD